MTNASLLRCSDGNQTPEDVRVDDENHDAVTANEANIGRQNQQEPFIGNEKQPSRVEVQWDKDDPGDPHNWKFAYKCFITFQLSLLALAPSFGSSVISPASQVIAQYIHVNEEVAVLNVSLYVLGFAVGPLIWAPLSEVWGRKISMLPALFCLGIFSIGTAVSKNASSVFITRFFGGVFGSAPISNVSAALGDIWSREARGTAVSLYAVMVTGGPTLGPVVGAALTAELSWRWTEYVEAIFVFAVWAFTFAFFPEVYGPVLLKQKAQRLRKETGNKAYYHPHEDLKLDFESIITKQLSRPVLMLTTEPMVICIAFYASFVYGVLYMTLQVFPIVFEDVHHLNTILASCSFLGLFIGVVFALSINIGNQPRYIRAVRASGGKPVPEARLPPMAIGGIIFTVGLFWFGWTGGYRSVNIAAPLVATILIGAGFNCIFQQCINFLIDTYGLYAASATAANTFLRSLMACGLPLAARPMFKAIGVGPGVSVLGGVAALALPVPFLFMKYGLRLRKKSRFAPID
ncbi:hypothetical protein PMZ80_009849 [Knufia obscura]|uniref:Major facilitator superfamily (MFS) profile domain-containing protein n=2 Tax=Knufia TaxID=430999 RepID=A0AAN8EHP2_9EURO|nr:hypothetical protein PMZ80_009849 [Knufia obscura]KAK5955944.1 hypothetical protein OHC33_002517 [Knufia fluminis]